MPNTMRTILLAAMLAISGGVASAGPFDDGITAYLSKDYETALKLFRPLADQGTFGAAFFVGRMYDNGEGVTEDNAEAVTWYRKAADQRDAISQYYLGGMYERGDGVTKSYVQAYMWWDLAAGFGNSDAKEGKSALEKKMTPAQIAEAQKLTREWKLSKQP